MISKGKNHDIVAQFYPARMRSPTNSQRLTRMTMEPLGAKVLRRNTALSSDPGEEEEENYNTQELIERENL